VVTGTAGRSALFEEKLTELISWKSARGDVRKYGIGEYPAGVCISDLADFATTTLDAAAKSAPASIDICLLNGPYKTTLEPMANYLRISIKAHSRCSDGGDRAKQLGYILTWVEKFMRDVENLVRCIDGSLCGILMLDAKHAIIKDAGEFIGTVIMRP
jgi:hypothetical protein